MRKRRGGYLILALAIISVFAFSSMAWAVDKVICVPWQGDPLKYHTTISGTAVGLKAVVKTDNNATRWYKWVFGDGSETAVATLSGATKYNVQTTHTYAGATGTPFTAVLMVDATDNSMSHTVTGAYLIKIEDNTLDARVNMAIDKGLWWLYTNSGGYYAGNLRTYNNTPFMAWYQSSYAHTYASPTASAIQAFAINNHKYHGDPDKDPYVEAVRLGMNFLVQGYYYYLNSPDYSTLRTTAIAPINRGGTPPVFDDPEAGQSSPNGYGIQTSPWSGRPIYEGGQIMDAIIASGVAPTDSTGRDFTKFDGTVVTDWTYKELLQDMADMYAWGQADSGSDKGGWRYSWNSDADNSACQWAAIGMIPAQKAPWNVVVPNWVKTYNINWLNYSHQIFGTGNIWGGFGYTGSGNGYGTSPSGLVQMAFDGQIGYDDPSTPADERDLKWIRTERYFADNWDAFRNAFNTYGFYAFAKAMRLAIPQQVERFASNSFDWYKGSASKMGMAQKIVEQQTTSGAAGYWAGGNYTNYPLTTAWMVITLRPALFQAAPIACFTAHPNPSYADQPINFDPSCSGHSETGKNISNLTKFEWDWDNDGIYDQSTTTPSVVTHTFSCAVLPCSYPVTLRVTDDFDPPLTAATIVDINITNPPHPPVAKAGGPYTVSLCSNDSLKLDGSVSFDPDEGQHEAGCGTCPNDTIIAWDWDLVPPLTSFTDKSGKTVTLVPAEIASYFPAGSNDIGLQVTDNTLLAFPASGQPNLTDANFAKVQVYDDCICNLAARPKSGKIQLTWTHTGAASYDVYRSTAGANVGFVKIASSVVTTYATYLDANVVNGTTYYYRVVASTGCGSNAASAKPTTR